VNGATPVPYRIIAACFRDHSVVPFLGAGASVAGASAARPLPTGAQFARFLAEQATYPGDSSDPLTKVAQYMEEVAADRAYLLSTVFSLFCGQVDASYRSCVMDFFGGIRPSYVPELIVTTNYDVLLETVLEQKGLPYLAISHILKGSKFAGRLLCYRSLGTPLTPESIHTVKQVENLITDMLQPLSPIGSNARASDKPILLYKMHGTAWMKNDAEQTIDSLVLTENDYVDFFCSRRPQPYSGNYSGASEDPPVVVYGVLSRGLEFQSAVEEAAVGAAKGR
jgi:SIR2-like domain